MDTNDRTVIRAVAGTPAHMDDGSVVGTDIGSDVRMHAAPVVGAYAGIVLDNAPQRWRIGRHGVMADLLHPAAIGVHFRLHCNRVDSAHRLPG